MKTKTIQYALPGCELGDYIKESIDFLRSHEPSEGYFVGFSGGKDSITTLELCRMAGVKYQAFYSCTRIDPPEMYNFIKEHYPQVTWLFSKESFWKLLLKNGPPFRMRRWCCNDLKKSPSKNIPLKYRIMGIRAEESVHRAKYPRIDKYRRNQIIIKPIFPWPEWAVWDFIEAYKLPYPALYDDGWSRIGCVICPFILGPRASDQKKIKIYQNRWPAIWKVFEKTVKKWAQKTIDTGLRKNQKFKSSEEFWQAYINGGYLYY